jgi:hypothetical protein
MFDDRWSMVDGRSAKAVKIGDPGTAYAKLRRAGQATSGLIPL